MTDELLDTLRALRSDPARAVDLYRQLFEASFFAVVKSESEENDGSLLFLTYPGADEMRELPLFTRSDFIIIDIPQDAVVIHIDGDRLWVRLLDIVESGKCEAAVDPGQTHGIRLSREMILGMVSSYSN